MSEKDIVQDIRERIEQFVRDGGEYQDDLAIKAESNALFIKFLLYTAKRKVDMKGLVSDISTNDVNSAAEKLQGLPQSEEEIYNLLISFLSERNSR